MPTQHQVSRAFGGVPFELDNLEGDLNPKYPGFADGKRISWGLAIEAVSGTWSKHSSVFGVDWTADFFPPKEFRIPLLKRSPSGRMRWQKVPSHCLLVTVHTGKDDINEARDVGRPAVRSLMAVLRREVPLLLPAQVVWEGGMVRPRKRQLRMTTVLSQMESAKGIGESRLQKMGLKLAKISTRSMPPQLRQALEWLNLARSASVRPEKFIHLWLAVLTLASFGQPKKHRDMKKIRNYTKTMGHGVGGVLSPLAIADLNLRLENARKIRNDLLHKADDSRITLDLLEKLELDAFRLVDFELAKLGTPISA